MPSTPTNSTTLFLKMAEAARRGVAMIPRSKDDKEYFAQDWFKERLEEANVAYVQQGRNSYPDFLVTSPPVEGYEVKSLAFTGGRPARRDIDFNSTIPSGSKNGQDVFLVFFLYQGTGADPRTVHTISVVHADLINADHGVAEEHVNVAVQAFGSYGDGFIRDRKMYVFPHPVSIDPSGLGKYRLIVPSGWQVEHPNLVKVKAVQRTVTKDAVDSYTILLHGRGQAQVNTVPYPDAGKPFSFDVFEMAELAVDAKDA